MPNEVQPAPARRICFDRVVPKTFAPARSMAQQAAFSRYVNTLQANAGVTRSVLSVRCQRGAIGALPMPRTSAGYFAASSE